MTTKWMLLAAAVCLLAGFAAGSLAWMPSAQGQMPPASPAWEYRVEMFYSGDSPKECHRKLNALAADGWEYAGPVHASEERRESTIAFKRTKR